MECMARAFVNIVENPRFPQKEKIFFTFWQHMLLLKKSSAPRNKLINIQMEKCKNYIVDVMLMRGA